MFIRKFERENKDADNDVKKKLLGLSDIEIYERVKALALYNYYKGKSKDYDSAAANNDHVELGQNWKVNDNLDYSPTQTISNKIKPLLRKQARWMFGKAPDIIIKSDESNDINNKLCEDLRKYLENILNNKFWKETRQAFLLSTIKKRVAVRIAAIPKKKYLKIRYETIDNISYKEIDGRIIEIKYFGESPKNATTNNSADKIYYIYKYYYKEKEIKVEESTVLVMVPYFSKLTYKGDDLNNPIEETEEEFNKNNHEIGFDDVNSLPCWVIKNSPDMEEPLGTSEVEDLIDLQDERNRKISDFADAIKFAIFGGKAIVDATEETVNDLKSAPGAIHAIKTEQAVLEKGKQATIENQEYSLSCAPAVIDFLNTLETDMKTALDMPDIKDLTNIPSAKAMKYLNNDLIARCEEKWSDWEPYLLELIDYILHISSEMKLPGWKEEFKNLIDKCTIKFKHNYPLPEDESEAKEVAMKEVDTGVRSKRSYLKDFSDEEDSEEAYKNILEEKGLEADIAMGSLGFNKDEDEGNDPSKEGNKGKEVNE